MNYKRLALGNSQLLIDQLIILKLNRTDIRTRKKNESKHSSTLIVEGLQTIYKYISIHLYMYIDYINE